MFGAPWHGVGRGTTRQLSEHNEHIVTAPRNDQFVAANVMGKVHAHRTIVARMSTNTEMMQTVMLAMQPTTRRSDAVRTLHAVSRHRPRVDTQQCGRRRDATRRDGNNDATQAQAQTAAGRRRQWST
jgi:hypothetical protein